MARYPLTLVVCFFLAIACASSAPASTYKRHRLSWESVRSVDDYRKFKGRITRSLRVERRRTIKLATTTFFNRRPYQFARPISDAQAIYVGVDKGIFYALDIKRMRKLWAFKTEGAVHAGGTLSGDHVFVGDVKGKAYALERRTGTLVWKFALDDEILAQPLIADERVYFFTQSGRLFALDRATGAELMHTEASEKSWGFSVRQAAAPVIADGILYVGTADGSLIAYDAYAGTIKWRRRLGDPRAQVYDVDTTPLIVADKLYAATADGRLFQLNRSDGRTIWETDAGGSGELLLHNKFLYASGGSILSAVNPENGHLVWSQNFDTPGISSPAAQSSTFLAVISTAKKLYLLDPVEGDILFERFVDKGSLSEPLVIGEQLFILSNTGRIFGFRITDRVPKKARSSQRADR